MSYGSSEFEQDATRVARTLHLSYRRAKYLLDRGYSGINASFPNTGDGIPMNNVMSRVAELVADYEANGNAKLNTVMAKSDLTLPGE